MGNTYRGERRQEWAKQAKSRRRKKQSKRTVKIPRRDGEDRDET